MELSNSNYIKACYGKNDGPIPIWIMRQAGRYLPEYLEVRSKVSFVELCKSPDLIAEVVHQPIRRFDLDAAILFSDILTLLEPMGAPVAFPEGGPKIEKTVDTPDDIKNLHRFDLTEGLPYVFEGIKKIKELMPDKPLIGFAGSPFTVACYLIQGQGSKTFDKAKQFLHQYPDGASELLNLLADVIGDYLAAQVEAGCDAVQLFDSWGGILCRDDYAEYSVKIVNKIFAKVKDKNVPRVLFVNNLAPYLDLVNGVDCEVVGVDYRMDLKTAAEALPGKAVQGNLDPSILYGSTEHVKLKTQRLLENFDQHERLIFNLGHGITPKTPISSVEAMIETVRKFR